MPIVAIVGTHLIVDISVGSLPLSEKLGPSSIDTLVVLFGMIL
jgi:hypothetical protein